MSGYLAPYGWKWPFWFGLIFTVVTLIPLCCLPETYAPTILSRRAKKMRKADPMCNKWAAIDLENKDLREMILVILTRPFRMFFYEAIVLFSCLYLALIYAVLYMFFQAYAIIFPGKSSCFPPNSKPWAHYCRYIWIQPWSRRTCLSTKYVSSSLLELVLTTSKSVSARPFRP